MKISTQIPLLVCLLTTNAVVSVPESNEEPTGVADVRRSNKLRQAQVVPPKVGQVKELRWINADTDQPTTINRPLATEGSSPFKSFIPLDEVPANVSLSLDAIVDTTNGPVGSVKFMIGAPAPLGFCTVGDYACYNWDIFAQNAVTMYENTAPYALCGNRGSDFFACPKLNDGGFMLTAQAFSGKSGTGVASDKIWFSFISYYQRVPTDAFLQLYDLDQKQPIGRLGASPINVTQTPRVSFRLIYTVKDRQYTPSGVAFYYDDDAETTPIVDRTANFFSFPVDGKNDTEEKALTPTVGTHTLKAIMYHSSGSNQGFGSEVQVYNDIITVVA